MRNPVESFASDGASYNWCVSKTQKRLLGDLGENIACEFLTKHGFEILTRNYLRKWGEIDIVARKQGTYRFIEVKSVSCVTLPPQVAHVTPGQTTSKHGYRPEDNVHPAKLKRLSRVMQTYMIERGVDADFQLDLVTVRIDERNRRARVELIENIII